MTIFLETECLILKTSALSDLDDLIALRSDPEVMKYIGNGHVQTKEEVIRFLNLAIPYQNKYGFGFCSVFEKESGEFVGQAGLFHLGFDESKSDIEIAYRLHQKYWGKGYAIELARALIQWGFQNLKVKRLIAVAHPDNVRSHRVLKNFGTYTGKIEYYGQEIPCYEIYKADAIELLPYDPEWPKMAAQEITYLRNFLPLDEIIDIQHIGSTAIPGIIAKPIIDIQIAVHSLTAIKQTAIDVLKNMGYEYWSDNPDPERMFFVKGMPPFGEKRTHHIHIVEPISRHWREKILFRDYLIAHHATAIEYEKIKNGFATRYTYDREKYTDAKTKFIKEILEIASQTNVQSAIDYIIQTFQKYDIIGLGEGGHHLENAHQFFQKIFDNKQIQEIVEIVILEFANTNYQDILNKYIFGEEVDFNELQKVWRESTQSPGLFGESPIYFNLLKKIRDINFTLPPNKKIHVLGGDPPINWKKIDSLEEYNKVIGNSRETFPAQLAIQFGINQKKKILVIYSEFHLTKVAANKTPPYNQTITSIVNTTQLDAMKVIGIVYSKTLLSKKYFTHLPIYSIIDLIDSGLRNVPASQFFEASFYNKEGKEMIAFEGYKLKELFDSLIYVGNFSSLTRFPMPSINFEKDYLHELNRRRNIFGWKPLDKK